MKLTKKQQQELEQKEAHEQAFNNLIEVIATVNEAIGEYDRQYSVDGTRLHEIWSDLEAIATYENLDG